MRWNIRNRDEIRPQPLFFFLFILLAIFLYLVPNVSSIIGMEIPIRFYCPKILFWGVLHFCLQITVPTIIGIGVLRKLNGMVFLFGSMRQAKRMICITTTTKNKIRVSHASFGIIFTELSHRIKLFFFLCRKYPSFCSFWPIRVPELGRDRPQLRRSFCAKCFIPFCFRCAFLPRAFAVAPFVGASFGHWRYQNGHPDNRNGKLWHFWKAFRLWKHCNCSSIKTHTFAPFREDYRAFFHNPFSFLLLQPYVFPFSVLSPDG